jgi:enamine deaminase RidA (YjgF/YER057c/UK114 family)
MSNALDSLENGRYEFHRYEINITIMEQTAVLSGSASKTSERLRVAGVTLPAPAQPKARFVAARQVGSLLFVSGHGPIEADGTVHCGKVGASVTTEDARAHARLTGLNVLSAAHQALGDLDRITAVVKLLGMVNATPEFTDHPKVIDGCSDLFIEILGEAGAHARSAIGVASLPDNITVEIEAIFAVEPERQTAGQ